MFMHSKIKAYLYSFHKSKCNKILEVLSGVHQVNTLSSHKR